MACIEEYGGYRIAMHPSWGENAVKDTNTGVLGLVPLFLNQRFLPSLQTTLCSKQITRTWTTRSQNCMQQQVAREKEDATANPKGRGKGVFSTLDTQFDPSDPFWMKFIRVKS